MVRLIKLGSFVYLKTERGTIFVSSGDSRILSRKKSERGITKTSEIEQHAFSAFGGNLLQLLLCIYVCTFNGLSRFSNENDLKRENIRNCRYL